MFKRYGKIPEFKLADEFLVLLASIFIIVAEDIP